jgi:carbamoyltransferase
MLTLGINALNHDSSFAVMENKILIHHQLGINSRDVLQFGKPDVIAYYERPWLKKTRHLYAGQYNHVFTLEDLPFRYLKTIGLAGTPIKYIPHHLSHAAGAVYQSGYDNCAIIVADAIGEWDTVTIWNYDGKFSKVYSKKYPYSLGIFYSAFTKLLGMKPMKDENKLMHMSIDGDPLPQYNKVKERFNTNLHKGVQDWGEVENPVDIAASVQLIFEDELTEFLRIARKINDKLVFTGGCAYNKLSHERVSYFFEEYHIPKFPGDSGSSIGAAFYQNLKMYKGEYIKC